MEDVVLSPGAEKSLFIAQEDEDLSPFGAKVGWAGLPLDITGVF